MPAFSPSLVSLTVRILLGILLCLAGAASASEPATGLALSPQQVKWLSRHRVIRIGFDPNYARYSFADTQGAFREWQRTLSRGWPCNWACASRRSPICHGRS